MFFLDLFEGSFFFMVLGGRVKVEYVVFSGLRKQVLNFVVILQLDLWVRVLKNRGLSRVDD